MIGQVNNKKKKINKNFQKMVDHASRIKEKEKLKL